MHCVPDPYFTIRKALAWRSSLHVDPPYQRESAIWSLDKKQLFIDSVLNGYDIPKIYLHDLRGQHPTLVYAVVDGKQRLTTIWDFVRDDFPLADDFHVHDATRPGIPAVEIAPRGGTRFSEFHPEWQALFRNTFLSVVLIQNANEEDIEDLFSRLNNGEPLNAAEKRNAFGGSVAQAVRELVRHDVFTSRLKFTNTRYHHHETATRFLALELAIDEAGRDASDQPGLPNGPSRPPAPSRPTRPDTASLPDLPDLRSAALDAFVRTHRTLAPKRRRELVERITARLDVLARTFEPHDPLLGRQADPPLYYLFLAHVLADPAVAAAATPEPADLRSFLADLEQRRKAELAKPEGEHDADLIELGRLGQQGGLDRAGLARRLAILRHEWELAAES